MIDRYESMKIDEKVSILREDLIERLRNFEGSDAIGNGDFSLLHEAADALEAAREDSARLDWLAGDAVLTSGWREHGTWETPALLVNSTRETCAPRDFRAAIDQARGKGGGEVGP